MGTKITKGSDVYETKFDLYYKNNNQKSILFYKSEALFSLDAACIQNNKEQYLFLFQENYGGNAVPEDIYGIFDPSAKKMLIKPEEWPKGNYKQVKKLIGNFLLTLIEDDKIFFCCSREQY